MAKLLSHVWSSISGSVGGITYLNGPHHAIIARSRVAPVQPGTLFQSMMRSSLNEASAQWEALTQVQQEDWEVYAQTCTFQGKQGNYEITGRSLFMAGRSLQRYINLRGLAAPTFVVTPPATTGFLLPSDFELVAAVGLGTGLGVKLTADLNDDTLVHVQISGPHGTSRNFYKGPWNTRDSQALIIPATVSATVDVLGLVDGAKYFVRVKCVADDASPRISQEWFGSTFAAVTGP